MENPKLALIPSGYKGGTNPTVYSILPNDATGDFNFDRASEGTRVRKDGLIEEVTNDVPRLDWLNSNCPSLLLEPQRTNLQVYSEQFDNSAWTKANSTIEANSIISPNGELSADKLVDTTTSAAKYVQDIASGLSTSSDATFSIFLKQSELSQVELLCAQNVSPFTNWARCRFDVSTLNDIGTTIGDFSYEDYGNGWIRLSITGTPVSSSAIIRITLSKNGTSSYTGTGTEGIYIFGAQVEQGDYASSYIKTEASTVTRLKDEIFAEDSNLFDITEGTLFVDATPFISGGGMEIQLSDGTANNRHTIQYQATIPSVRALTVTGGTTVFSDYNPLTFDIRNKLAITFKKDEFKFYVNGSLVHTDTSGDVPTGLDKLTFSNPNLGANFMEGKIHDIRVYDTVLTEAEAIELTTL